MNVFDKIDNKTATLDDQEEALKASWSAYEFAELNISGTDIEKCQESACKYSGYAYKFAKDIPGANIEYCQEHACKNPEYAYWFARDIPGADIEYCRKACESDSEMLKAFDQMIAKKSIRMNVYDKIYNKIATLDDQEEALKGPWTAYRFAKLNIPGTDFEKCQEVACNEPSLAYIYAKNIPGADIDYCKMQLWNDKYWMQQFNLMIAEKIKSVML